TGVDPSTVIIPVQQFYFEWALSNSTALQVALANFQGQVQYHHPPHPLLKMTVDLTLQPRQLSQRRPAKGDTVFSDASGKTGKAAVAWKQDGQWHSHIVYQEGSPQVVELRAAALAFQYFPGPLNLITDSAYVAALLPRLDMAVLGHVNNPKLFAVLTLVWEEILKRHFPFYVMHVNSHTSLPGFVIEGKAKVDALVSVALSVPVPDIHKQAVLAHQFYHQNWRSLYHQFGQKSLFQAAARSIVAACPDCQNVTSVPNYG
ncbi:POK19 protein, partial [Steatornis caripensis]|nr:POK19 protein [Steatornis caripensis]